MHLCECLINKVGLRGICETPEPCVYYVNDLPLLSAGAFNSLTDKETDDYRKAFQTVEKEAILKLQTDLKTKLRGKFKVNTKNKAKPKRSGKFKKPFVDLDLENCLIGHYWPLKSSDYLCLDLLNFSIYSQLDQDITLYVFDTESGELIDTIEAPLTIGLNKIDFPANTTYSSYSGIYIAYDAAIIQSRRVESVYHQCDITGYCSLPSCVGCAGNSNSCYKFPYIGDPQIVDVCEEDLISGECGIVFKYKIECSLIKWMCCYTDDLCNILRFGIGVQFFMHLAGQVGKVNKYSLMDQESLEKLSSYYKDTYNNMIDEFIESIEGDCCCFECDEMVSLGKIIS